MQNLAQTDEVLQRRAPEVTIVMQNLRVRGQVCAEVERPFLSQNVPNCTLRRIIRATSPTPSSTSAAAVLSRLSRRPGALRLPWLAARLPLWEPAPARATRPRRARRR